MEIWGIFLIMGGIIGVIIFIANMYEKKRREKLQEVAASLAMTFESKDEGKALRHYLQGFRLTSLGRGRKVYNIFTGTAEALQLRIFDYRYTVGGGKSSSTYNQTVFLVESPDMNLTKFKMRPENVFHRIGSSFGMQDIDFEEFPVFSKQYLLQGDDEGAIRALFDREKLSHFTEDKGLCVEGNGNKLLIYRNGKRLSPEEIPIFVQHNLKIANMFIGN